MLPDHAEILTLLVTNITDFLFRFVRTIFISCSKNKVFIDIRLEWYSILFLGVVHIFLRRNIKNIVTKYLFSEVKLEIHTHILKDF